MIWGNLSIMIENTLCKISIFDYIDASTFNIIKGIINNVKRKTDWEK